jgi:hypothetical protein
LPFLRMENGLRSRVAHQTGMLFWSAMQSSFRCSNRTFLTLPLQTLPIHSISPGSGNFGST